MAITQPTPTSALIVQHYKAAMDSVNLINKITVQPTITATDVATVDRNTRHLQIMLENILDHSKFGTF